MEEMRSGVSRVAFIGSECYPFVKTGGLGDVMYALPRALAREGADIRVLLPLYSVIPQKYKDQMVWKGSFMMDLTQDGRSFFVGIMELTMNGVTYDFIENREFFDWGNPYTGLWEDIPKYCYFSKAALAALNYLEWVPDIVHCHDWQAALVPVYLRTRFALTPVGAARSILTIHNLRFQGICSIDHLKYWSGLQDDLYGRFDEAVAAYDGQRDALDHIRGILDTAINTFLAALADAMHIVVLEPVDVRSEQGLLDLLEFRLADDGFNLFHTLLLLKQ